MILSESLADLLGRPLLPKPIVHRLMQPRRLLELPRLRPRTIRIGPGLRLDYTVPLLATIPVDLIVNRRMMSAEQLADVPRLTTPAQLTENDLTLFEPLRFPPAHPPYPSLDNSGTISSGCRCDHLSPPCKLPRCNEPMVPSKLRRRAQRQGRP